MAVHTPLQWVLQIVLSTCGPTCHSSDNANQLLLTPWTGFDATPHSIPTAAVTIQQPNGNIKRIAYANGSCAPSMTRSFVYDHAHFTCISVNLSIHGCDIMTVSNWCISSNNIFFVAESWCGSCFSFLVYVCRITDHFAAPTFPQSDIAPTEKTHLKACPLLHDMLAS